MLIIKKNRFCGRSKNSEPRQDCEESCRKMRYKSHFRNGVSETFSEIATFRPKSSWLPPKGRACLEIFLSRL